MYSYVSSLDQNFEYQNFSEAGLDEMNVDLVWLLDPKEKLISSFENDTDDARYHHPGQRRGDGGDQPPHAAGAHRARPGRHVAPGADQWCDARDRRTHHPAQRSQWPGGRHAGIRAPHRRAGNRQHRRRHTAQCALRACSTTARWPTTGGTARGARRAPHRATIRTNLIEGQLRLDSIGNQPLAVLYTTLPRSVMQSGQQGVRYLVGPGGVARQHRGRRLACLPRPPQAQRRCGRHQRDSLPRHLRSRRIRHRAVRSHFAPGTRRQPAGAAPGRRLAR